MRHAPALALALAFAAGCAGDPPAGGDDPLLDLDPGAIWRNARVTTVATWDDPALSGWTREQTYDAGGWPIVDRYDADDDATDAEQRWERDDAGLVVRWEVDFGLDGTTDLTEDWTYDPDGVPEVRELDADGDGVLDERSTYTADGGLLAEELFDLGADGTPDTRYTYDHDALGRQVKVYGDDRLDGRTDYAARWSWFEVTDLLVEHTRDEGNEGLVDYEERHEYDADRRETWRVVSDRGGTGQNHEWTFRYDDGDPWVDGATWLLRIDGELVQAVEVAYRWDDRGRALGSTWSYAASEGGPVDFVLTQEITWSTAD